MNGYNPAPDNFVPKSMAISQSRPSRRLFWYLPHLVSCLLPWLTPVAHGGWFTELSAASGLDFTHFNGMSGEF